MNNKKNGTSIYKIVCAVVFVLFCFLYLYYYQTDVLAAAQHVASRGRTHYEPVLGSILIFIALKLLQDGIQAVARLKRIFYALTYFPSFLLLTFITDMPSGPVTEIHFGAWAWALPLALIVWVAVVIMARQYQPIEVDARGGGLFSQVAGINLTVMLFMMLMTCLIGNHNRLYHQRMHVENLISHKEYLKAQKDAESFNSDDATLSMLRASALAEQHRIGDELFKYPVKVNSIIPSSNGNYTIILSMRNLLDSYRRNADWQLCQMLVRKDLNTFYDNLVFFYDLETDGVQPDSTANKPAVSKSAQKKNEYQDSLMSIRYQKLPVHYQEALLLYNYINSRPNAPKRPLVKQNYFRKDLLEDFNSFLSLSPQKRKEKYTGTYWLFYGL